VVVFFGEVIDERALADACAYKWYKQTLCQVNESVVRLGLVQGEYHRHKHNDDDEFFYVVEGKLLIDPHDRIRATTVELTKYRYPGGVPAHHGMPLLMA